MRLPILLLLLSMSLGSLQSATYPSGFSEALVTSGLSNPTSMAFAPDGRLFVCEQGGRLRVIKNGSLLAAPFLTVTVDSLGERGLLGIAFDPNFTTNSYVYVYYTATTPATHNRVSRFTASGDTALPGETVLLDLENLSAATNHNGGGLHFGADGRLYISVGENANSANSQTLSTRLGKMLRVNPDGTIPMDNPFVTTASGLNQAIWAMGLRNPFTFAVQPGTGRIFINDVGQDTWEEINDGIAGSNYGWSIVEGIAHNSSYRDPLFAYGHGSGATLGCAITGGTFYNPPVNPYPAGYTGVYFFSDYCGGWIRKLDPANGNAVSGFATGISSAVDLKTGDDGLLYYLTRGAGAVYKVMYAAAIQAPAITANPQSQVVPVGQSVTFTISASGSAPLSYQWQRGTTPISGATSSSYTIAAVAVGDNGAQFRCVVTNTAGSATSASATLTVTSPNTPPTPVITAPAAGTLYTGGMTINYSGTGTDTQDGTLPPSAFTWQVDFHHDTHIHPFIQATTGSTGGSFIIPTLGETSANVWYRIYLTVRDSGGLTTTVYRDVQPMKVNVTLSATQGVTQLTLDGQPVKAPYSFTGVVGITRSIGAVSTQKIKGKNYGFVSWSDGGAQTHNIATPAVNTTYTATYTRK